MFPRPLLAAFSLAAVALALLALSRSARAQTPPGDVVLDTLGNSVGLAQQAAHVGGLQGRILWMDAGANVGNLSSPEKIKDIVGKVKAAGLNMIVLDVKPIVGDTIYPSQFAPRLLEWKGQKVDASLDVLRETLTQAHAVGIPVYANMSVFGEGHKFVRRGLAYTHPDWQTVLYDVTRRVGRGQAAAPINTVGDLPPNENALAVVTDAGLLNKPRPGLTVAVLNFDARVTALYDGAALDGKAVTIPLRGSALLGTGRAGAWLRQNAVPGEILSFAADPKFVPVVDVASQKITMFCDPIHPEVRRHNLDIVREIVTNYDVDGVVFDDRLRYAAITADMGPRSRAAFEAFVGRKLTWPDDILRLSPFPGQEPIYGLFYQQWLTWRAGNIKSWLAEAAGIVRGVRPTAQVAVYVGSWYGDYEKVGSNWASENFEAPYRWQTPAYQQTGYADLLDWLTTGCYYEKATLAEAQTLGDSLGATVEAAGQLSNRVVDDAAWTYAGLYALSYQGRPDQFARAIQAAAASTQGVMVFDLSQIVEYNWWRVMADAFAARPAQPPSLVPGLLQTIRRDRDARRAQGVKPPPPPPYLGIEDTGF